MQAANLCCPIDNLLLERSDKQWQCANGHSFDIAKQGYVNLLPVQHKRSKHPGDSKEMVLARTRFLNSGLYQNIAESIAQVIKKLLPDNETICILDAGCGEGYYFDYLFNSLTESNWHGEQAFVGLDISKDAILQASKRNKQITWIVGTNRKPPIMENSIDIILCVFGFVNFDGFNKILKPNGKVILVDPEEMHLKELRELIYEKVKLSHLSEINTDLFSITDNQSCQFKTRELNNENINDLLMMTPHLFRANKDGKDAVSDLQNIELTVDVAIRTLVKNRSDVAIEASIEAPTVDN